MQVCVLQNRIHQLFLGLEMINRSIIHTVSEVLLGIEDDMVTITLIQEILVSVFREIRL